MTPTKLFSEIHEALTLKVRITSTPIGFAFWAIVAVSIALWWLT